MSVITGQKRQITPLEIYAGDRLLYRSQPKQTIFHTKIEERSVNGYRDFLYGGAGGGGKSVALRWQAHNECLSTPGLRILFLRASFAELETTHLTDIVTDLPDEWGRLNKSNKRFTYYNGSFIQFGYGERVEDFKRYLSTEYDIVMIDELTTLPFKLALLIKNMRLRTTKPGFIPYFAAATNPGSISHSEVKSFFIDKDFLGRFPELAGTYHPEKVSYTRALVYDNKLLLQSDPELLGRMQSLPPDERKRLLEGSWDIFEGQFFTQFRTDIHVIKPVQLPSDCLTFAGLDYGVTTAMMLIKYNRNNNTYYVVGEWMAKGKEKEEIATYCHEYLQKRGLLGITIVGDHNMFPGDKNTKPEKTAAYEFRKLGLKLIHASKKRAPTMLYRKHCNREVKQLLSWEKNLNDFWIKKPRLYIFETCNYIARTLPALRIDPNDNEDIDPESDDHGYDALKMPIINHMRGQLSADEEEDIIKKILQSQR